MVDSWYCLDRVILERMSQVSKGSEIVYISGAPSTPGYLLALLRELSQCPRALTTITKLKQVRKTNLTGFLYHFKKKGGKSILTFRTYDLVIFFFEGFRSTLTWLKKLNSMRKVYDDICTSEDWTNDFPEKEQLPSLSIHLRCHDTETKYLHYIPMQFGHFTTSGNKWNRKNTTKLVFLSLCPLKSRGEDFKNGFQIFQFSWILLVPKQSLLKYFTLTFTRHKSSKFEGSGPPLN